WWIVGRRPVRDDELRANAGASFAVLLGSAHRSRAMRGERPPARSARAFYVVGRCGVAPSGSCIFVFGGVGSAPLPVRAPELVLRRCKASRNATADRAKIGDHACDGLPGYSTF